jgi:hypothetical protein
MGDVLKDLTDQLAELKAFKEAGAPVMGPA